ncbi:hypothetical protein CEP54_003104 [Fusarium duplospermum]|uniref:Uncharacterized protein n=1 Tax=Fusarium duplospermum TaxID=1325734 RepID=A0A428QR36_9HYPO|nr:hypothetical protein CEP54_003104 [Fusarium duplospermum]
MTRPSDTHRDTSRRERRSRGKGQTPQHHQQPQPSASQAQYQQLPQQQQHQHTNSYASSSGYAATGGHGGYATPQGQYETPGYDAHGYPQTPSTPRAHQGSAPDSQYSPDRDNTRVRIRGHRDDPEDPALRTESFVREGNKNRVASSRSSQSGRAIQKKKEDRARTVIDEFNAAYTDAAYTDAAYTDAAYTDAVYTDAAYGPANPLTNQYNSASGQYNVDPYDPNCGDGPNYGGSSYGGD